MSLSSNPSKTSKTSKSSKLKNILLLIFLLLVISENTKFCSCSNARKIKKMNLKTDLLEINQKEEFNFNDLLIVKGECSPNNCKETGKCTNSDCVCNDGYAQDPKNPKPKSSDMRCNYKLKSQALYFIIEMFTWIGIGHIYAGRLLYGLVKLVVVLLIITIDCFLRKFFSRDRGSKSSNILFWMVYLFYFFILFWQVFDLVMIALNKNLDGNGMTIKTFDSNQFK